MKINILFPVLNEEKRLQKGIENTIAFMEKNPIFEYKLTIVDNGSTDKTKQISLNLCETYKQVDYLALEEKGVGLAIREGVKLNTCEIVGYMDIDLSTKLDHLIEVKNIFKNKSNVEIVNGSRLHKKSKVIGRKFSRELTSRGLNFLLKLFLGMKISDSLCGFKFFRVDTIEQLMARSSKENGWFFCVEMLIRAEKLGIKIEEIPVVWQDDYDTTVKVGKLIRQYVAQIIRLFNEFIIKKNY